MNKYGTKCDHEYERKSLFYHGVSEIMAFNQTVIHLIGPVSTSTIMEVTYIYAKDQGIIITLFYGKNSSFIPQYFACKWLSDFVNEEEKFFIQQVRPLEMQSIITKTDKKNYYPYIQCLKIINMLFGNINDPFGVDIDDIDDPLNILQIDGRKFNLRTFTFKLLEHALNKLDSSKYSKWIKYPLFIKKLLNQYTDNKKDIIIYWFCSYTKIQTATNCV